MNRRRLLALFAASCGTIALAACTKIGSHVVPVATARPIATTSSGPFTSPPPAHTPPAVATGTALSVATPTARPTAAVAKPIRAAVWTGPAETRQLQTLVDTMNRATAVFHITLQPVSGNYMAQIRPQLAAASAPDLLWLQQQDIVPLGAAGALVDLTSHVAKEHAQPVSNLTDYFPTTIEPFRFAGKLFGLPWQVQPSILYANLDLFQQQKLALPDSHWDWKTFLSAAQQLTVDSSGRHPTERGFNPATVRSYGFSLQVGWPPIELWAWQAGGELVAPDLRSCPIDSPGSVRGEQFKADLRNTYRVTPPFPVLRKQGFAAMMADAGVIGMFVGGAADDLDHRPRYKGKGFVVPKGPGGQEVTWAWVGGSAVAAKSTAPDAAFSALLAMCDAIQRWRLPAPRKSLATSATILKANPAKAVSVEAILASLAIMRTPPSFPNDLTWAQTYATHVEQPLLDNRGLATVLAKRERPALEKLLPPAHPPTATPGTGRTTAPGGPGPVSGSVSQRRVPAG